MTIHHHLHDATLMAWAAGNLSEGMRFVIATHLDLCAHCRDRLADMDVVGAAVVDDADPIAMSDGALDRMMAMLDGAGQVPAPEKPAGKADPQAGQLPAPLRDYVPDGLDQVVWRNLAPGIKYSDIEGIRHDSGSLRLMKIAPGATIPQHGHTGTELTLVLRGSYCDEIGRFKAGDIADLGDDMLHQPVADGDEDCICLIITEGKLKFNSLLPKIVQYFTGM